jgi:glucose-1-phosphate cytidylyltransferase
LVEEKNFYVMNVDDICSYNPDELYRAQRNSNAILIKQAKLPFGAVEIGSDMKVADFVEKPLIDKYVSCGHYVFNRKLVEQFLPTEGDLEQTLLRELAKQGLLYAHVLTGKWITINTFKDLLEARRGGLRE